MNQKHNHKEKIMRLNRRTRIAKKLAIRFPNRHSLVRHKKTVVNKETGVKTILVRDASKGMDVYPIPANIKNYGSIRNTRY